MNTELHQERDQILDEAIGEVCSLRVDVEKCLRPIRKRIRVKCSQAKFDAELFEKRLHPMPNRLCEFHTNLTQRNWRRHRDSSEEGDVGAEDESGDDEEQ